MFRRYHHGHSAMLGFLLALALERHLLVIVLGALVAGVVLGRAWWFWTTMAGALRDKLLHSKREPISTRPVPVYSARRGRDDIPF